MAVLRDLVARLGLDFDGKAFNEGEKAVGSLKGAMSSLAQAAAAGAIAKGLFELTKMASDASETMNVLSASFGEQEEDVTSWATTFAKEAGRSEFLLREMAGTLGAVLNPMMEGNTEAAAEMSTGFAALAVDLGSFFNAADDDALQALRSGLVGEAEPLKRFGIVMNEATLASFALDQGIRKSVKSMSNAEKTTLRYNFIMSQTVNAQGDAAKTSEGWANASKAVAASLTDLGTKMGLVLLPFAEKTLGVVRGIIDGFTVWAENSKILEAALIVLGGILVAIGIKMLIAFAPVILAFLKIALIIAVVTLAIDDFLTFLDGGDSVIGRFINMIFGPGSATAAANALKEAWAGLVLFFKTEVVPVFKLVLAHIGIWIESVMEAWQNLFSDMRGGWKILSEIFGKISNWLGTLTDKMAKFGGEVLGVLDTAAGFLGIDTNLSGENPGTGAAAPSIAAGAGGAAGAAGATVINNFNTTVQGNADTGTANEIGRQSARAAGKAGRGTLNALTQKAAG
jgi:hypothetical protein